MNRGAELPADSWCSLLCPSLFFVSKAPFFVSFLRDLAAIFRPFFVRNARWRPRASSFFPRHFRPFFVSLFAFRQYTCQKRLRHNPARQFARFGASFYYRAFGENIKKDYIFLIYLSSPDVFSSPRPLAVSLERISRARLSPPASLSVRAMYRLCVVFFLQYCRPSPAWFRFLS